MRVVSCMLGLCLVVPSTMAVGQDTEKSPASAAKVRAIYADAAEFQNNGAFELAIEEWQKLLKQYPNDPLAGKASHYLGVSYIQTQDYQSAIKAFRKALEDRDSDVRDESLINLGWCLFTQARAEKPDSRAQKSGFDAAKKELVEFAKNYPTSDFLDQAFFYLGEIEYTLGNVSPSIQYYQRLLNDPKFRDSPLRPDARYAIAIAFEESKDQRQASTNYRKFLADHKQHRLVQEVSVRLADLFLADGKADEAEKVLAGATGNGELADYTLLRLGYALSSQGKSQEAADKYQQLLRRYPDSPHASAAAISVGQLLYRQGKYDEAVEQFQKAVKGRDPVAEDAVHWIAITYARQNKTEEGKQLLEEALRWANDNVDLQMDYADVLYNLPDQMEKARAAYSLIATKQPEHPLAPRAAYNAAFSSLQLRDFEKAREWSKWFLTRFPRDPLRNDVAYVAAETLLQDGEYTAAAKAYEQLLKSDSSGPSSNLWRIRQATAYYLDGDYGKSIPLVSDAETRFTESAQKAEALFILGASLHFEERHDEAIRKFVASQRASTKWESADEVLLLLAEAYQRTGKAAPAIQTLKDLLKQYPNSRLAAQAKYRLGQLAAGTGDKDAAIQYYRAVLADSDAAKFHGYAQYGIAWCLMQQEDFDAALSELSKVTSRAQGGTLLEEAMLAKGICQRKLNQLDAAIETLTQFLETSPSGTSLGNVLYELGLAYTDKGNLTRANGYLQRLLREVPDYPSREKVLYELAWNFQDEGDRDKAGQFFQRLAEDHANSDLAGEAKYMLAESVYDKKDYTRAVKLYQSVLQVVSEPALREKAMYKLGWSFYQQEDFERARKYFEDMSSQFARGTLQIDAVFMAAECLFKQNQYDRAFRGYQRARSLLESRTIQDAGVSEQVKSLVYLHGGQCLREAKRWQECESWLRIVVRDFPQSSFLATALYELGYCRQQLGDTTEALKLYSEVAEEYRNEVGARARFMMGEIHFEKRDFAKAIPEFQRVMYGFGGDKAPDSIKNWQVKSAFEAARCSELLVDSLGGAARQKVIETAQEFYTFIVEKHGAHDLAAQAKNRLGDLQKLR